MKNLFKISRAHVVVFSAACLLALGSTRGFAQGLADGLVSYWPLDEVVGDKTPDLVGGYDLAPLIGGGHTAGTAADIRLVPGFKGNAASFDNVNQTLLGYIARPNDELPINQHPAFTVSLWVNGAPNQNDRRIFSEGNLNNNNPLFNIGSNAGGGGLDFYFRQNQSQAEIDAGFGNFGNPVNHSVTTGIAFDNTWHHVVFAQQEDGTQMVYIDGVADTDVVLWTKTEGAWNLDGTSIGGILRQAAAAWITADIDEVALWKRALSTEEINMVLQNGIPATFQVTRPLEIRSFTADRTVVSAGESVLLRWESNTDATLNISPGVGDVTANTDAGSGSTTVTVDRSTTYTMTASRNGESVTAQVRVNAQADVAAGWSVLENFDFLEPGNIGGQGRWQNPAFTIGGAALNTGVVLEAGRNRVLSFTGENILAGNELGSLTIDEGEKTTLFFRFLISPDLVNEVDPLTGLPFGLKVLVGFTEKGLRDVGDFAGGNNGPAITLDNYGAGAIVDFTAINGVGGLFGSYTYVFGDPVNNPQFGALEVGEVYNVWMDVENRPFDVVDGIQNGGDLYSVHLQKDGDTTRSTLFTDFLSDRDGITVDAVLGGARPNLTTLLFLLDNAAAQGENTIFFDDFYLSQGDFNSAVPVSVSSFELGPAPELGGITGIAFAAGHPVFLHPLEEIA